MAKKLDSIKEEKSSRYSQEKIIMSKGRGRIIATGFWFVIAETPKVRNLRTLQLVTDRTTKYYKGFVNYDESYRWQAIDISLYIKLYKKLAMREICDSAYTDILETQVCNLLDEATRSYLECDRERRK